ncbi:MAG: phosphatidylglycerophosphatase A [Halieaceae bacterium]|jgi:phosphatidylglycerophosphatase A
MNESDSTPVRPNLRDPVQLLAFGFGSGLAPVAPGTAGTIAAIPIYLLFAELPLLLYAGLVLLATAAGIWLCGRASDALGVHDHGGIVWDEFVGLWITLFAVPFEWPWILLGFLFFRLYDIAKPWPVSWLDRQVAGGLGIMADDVVAGLMACLSLHLVIRLVGP